MNFKDLSDKEKKLVISYKFDLFRDKCIKLKEKRALTHVLMIKILI